jgi:small subunit ribosomal protein S19e
MVTVFDVHAEALINKAAEALKKEDSVKAPEWAKFAKTGHHKERPPVNPEWWYIRCAAILRSVYILGPVGVSKLSKKYGGIKNRGLKPKKFFTASGSVLRKALQQLQAAGLVEYREKGLRKGRVIAGKGKQLLDNLAKELN